MSADNYLLVTRSGDMFEVYHLFASDDDIDLEKLRPIWAEADRDAALRFAHTWARDNVCEYGVVTTEDVWE
jgi:hypothetical protein